MPVLGRTHVDPVPTPPPPSPIFTVPACLVEHTSPSKAALPFMLSSKQSHAVTPHVLTAQFGLVCQPWDKPSHEALLPTVHVVPLQALYSIGAGCVGVCDIGCIGICWLPNVCIGGGLHHGFLSYVCIH